MPVSNSFRKKDKILKRADYLRIGSRNKKIRTKHFLILFERSDFNLHRLGITASKKTGNSVKRNRIKRVIREFFRLNRKSLGSVKDIIIIAGRDASRLGYEEVREELIRAFARGRGKVSILNENDRR